MDNIIIRTVKKSDAKRIASLSVQLEHSMSESEAKERLAVILKNKTQALFVAQDKSEVLGYVSVSANYELLNGVQCRIGGLVVDAQARGRGLGTKLMAKAEEWAKSKGSKTMKLSSNVKRIDSHRFYEKIGYLKTTGESRHGKLQYKFLELTR